MPYARISVPALMFLYVPWALDYNVNYCEKTEQLSLLGFKCSNTNMGIEIY